MSVRLSIATSIGTSITVVFGLLTNMSVSVVVASISMFGPLIFFIDVGGIIRLLVVCREMGLLDCFELLDIE